jgi:subtilisin family serine protease
MSADADAGAGEVVELFGVGAGGPCSGLFESLRDTDGAWLHPVMEARVPGLSGQGITAAVVDTGLSLEHPRLQQAVVERTDVTGEGEGDECGHGTVVALIFLASVPDAKLVDVKALGRDARSSPQNLIRALDWIGARGGVDVVNLSAGVYRPWCSGDCDVCQAASRLSRDGPRVVVAAGNRPGLTACPAKSPDVFPVAELNPLMQGLTETSSPAGLHGFVERSGPYRVERS